MQIYALDEKAHLTSSHQALRQRNYCCPECGGVVRLRGGEYKQLHFYHLSSPKPCRLGGKSLTHLAIQQAIQKILSPEESELEVRFPTINRIADVVWLSEHLIFEIQCSPITALEISERNRDYASLGYQVIWILHDKAFNRFRLSAAEKFLRSHPHYYTNMDIKGEGMIYDQYRPHRFRAFPIDLSSPVLDSKKKLPKKHGLSRRARTWPLYFSGDLLDLCPPLPLKHPPKKRLPNFYKIFFNLLLEKKCD